MSNYYSWIAGISFAVVTSLGCGTTTSPPPSKELNPEVALNEIKTLYEYLATQKLKTPTAFGDLAEYSGTLEIAYPMIADGQLVLIYNRNLSPGSNELLAYAKEADTKGGHVLLRNGTIKQVTSAEFGTLRK